MEMRVHDFLVPKEFWKWFDPISIRPHPFSAVCVWLQWCIDYAVGFSLWLANPIYAVLFGSRLADPSARQRPKRWLPLYATCTHISWGSHTHRPPTHTHTHTHAREWRRHKMAARPFPADGAIAWLSADGQRRANRSDKKWLCEESTATTYRIPNSLWLCLQFTCLNYFYKNKISIKIHFIFLV